MSEPKGRVLDLQWSELLNGQKFFPVSEREFGQQTAKHWNERTRALSHENMIFYRTDGLEKYLV